MSCREGGCHPRFASRVARAVAILGIVAITGCRLHFDDVTDDAGDAGDAGSDVAMLDASFVAHAETYFKASNTDALDSYGESLALSADGNTLAVGAIHEASDAVGVNSNQASNTVTHAGAVYVYRRAGATWVQEAYVKASNTDINDDFGWTVALSADGNTLAVGAFQEGSASTGINQEQTNNAAGASGAAYVFTRTTGTWTQQAYVKASNTGAGDFYGWSLALSGDGNTLAVGAVLEASSAIGINGTQADNTAPGAGAVYVYTRAGTTWSQQAYVKASNTNANDYFGWAVAVSNDGNTLAVSAKEETSAATGVGGAQGDNTAMSAGAVYVYTRAGTTWSQQAYVKASNTGVGDTFGSSVAISGDGNTLAVGAVGEDAATTGVNNPPDEGALDSGATYVYTRAGTTWSQRAYLKASNTGAGDAFGYSVALSADGSTLAVSGLLEDSAAVGINGTQADEAGPDSGAVYVFVGVGTMPVQTTYLKGANSEGGDGFGRGLGLSSSGLTLAVSARDEDGAALGVGGNQADNSASNSGAAYVTE
ncbi:MAG: FG-GAP repeat protein [Myxococcales bacterium]|nr:FG-GAP repeat protein [Myxococcales bacterium]